ncbi:MAG: hypothetical protein ACE5JO_00510 [Candidatus Binatia bacterium]
MNTLAILTLMFLLLPESALACAKHAISLDGLLLKSPAAIFFNIVLLFIITFPLGFVAGRTARRLSPAGRIATSTLVTTALLMVGDYRAWACHGAETVGPILKEIHAAQLVYHKKQGVYAPSFEELGMEPSSNQYSYFLPSETLSAIDPLPKEGVDLSRLPEGIFPVASADKFTVVALAFAEPNRIDVWTMDQDKVFKEWSVPAVPKVEIRSQKGQLVTMQGTFKEMLNKFEGPLMGMTFLLGLGIGFILSTRAPLNFTPAN